VGLLVPPAPVRRSRPVEGGNARFCQHQTLIADVIRSVTRRRRLSQEDAEDFAGTVTLRLLADDCAVLQRFEGRSSLRTFLVRVVERMLLDQRVHDWGKWRPTAQARRLGKVAIELERLTSRDGLTFAEAAETLRTSGAVTDTPAHLWRLYSLLPPRTRRRTVPESELETVAASGPSPENLLCRDDSRRTVAALHQALARLSIEERTLLEHRYLHNTRLVSIAKLTGVQQKALYRRFGTVLKRLRRDLEALGIDGAAVRDYMAFSDAAPGLAHPPLAE
jgi:RNA polymerase sigma factor (sigma-70 family)